MSKRFGENCLNDRNRDFYNCPAAVALLEIDSNSSGLSEDAIAVESCSPFRASLNLPSFLESGENLV